MNYPANPNPALPARHALFVGSTGSGKSQAMCQNPDIPKKGKRRVIIWDPHSEFRADRVDTIHALCGKLALCRGKDDFTLAYSGRATAKNFELFCNAVYHSLDGNKLTFLFVDELASVAAGIAKDDTYSGNLLREGRKFGLVYNATAVSTAEIPKTFVRSVPFKYFAKMDYRLDVETAVSFLNITREQYFSLPDNPKNSKGQATKLHFWFKADGKPASQASFKIIKTTPKPI